MCLSLSIFLPKHFKHICTHTHTHIHTQEWGATWPLSLTTRLSRSSPSEVRSILRSLWLKCEATTCGTLSPQRTILSLTNAPSELNDPFNVLRDSRFTMLLGYLEWGLVFALAIHNICYTYQGKVCNIWTGSVQALVHHDIPDFLPCPLGNNSSSIWWCGILLLWHHSAVDLCVAHQLQAGFFGIAFHYN